MEKPQYAILRFAKYKGSEIGRIEAHDERTKEMSWQSFCISPVPEPITS